MSFVLFSEIFPGLLLYDILHCLSDSEYFYMSDRQKICTCSTLALVSCDIDAVVIMEGTIFKIESHAIPYRVKYFGL